MHAAGALGVVAVVTALDVTVVPDDADAGAPGCFAAEVSLD